MSLTAKQELFCQAVASGQNQTEAYRTAYGATGMGSATIAVKASVLMDKAEVIGRIEEIRRPAVISARITLESHLEDLKELRDSAAAEGKWGPAVAAEISRGKAAGLYIIKTEDVTDPLKKAMANMTPQDAERMLNTLDQVDAALSKAKTTTKDKP